MDKVLEKVLADISKRYAIAGGFIVAVKDGKTIIRECFGKADIENGIPMEETSVFTLASVSKTFTSTLAAMLVDEGLLDWDKPIRTWWPDFYLGDDYVSAHVTLKDLLCHRTGLSSHNSLRRNPSFHEMDSRYVDSIQRLPLSAGFREKFIYCNEGYRLAAALMERVTGKSYEVLLRERIGTPVGMDLYCEGEQLPPELKQTVGYSANTPVAQREPVTSIMGTNNPGGGIRTNLRSMEKYCALWANKCCLPDGTPLISEASYNRVQTGILFWSHPTPPERSRCYAMGWAPSVYRGYKAVYHGGCIQGYNTSVTFFPELNAACAVCLNTNATSQRQVVVLRQYMYDIICGYERSDYEDLLVRWEQVDAERAAKPKPEVIDLPISREELEACTGVWWNDAYNRLELDIVDDHLHVSYGVVTGTMYYVGNNEFRGKIYGNPGHIVFDKDKKHAYISMTLEDCLLPYRRM